MTFLPDSEIFDVQEFSSHTLEERLRETAFLTRGLRISLTDERGEGSRVDFHYEGGIEDFVSYLNEIYVCDASYSSCEGGLCLFDGTQFSYYPNTCY